MKKENKLLSVEYKIRSKKELDGVVEEEILLALEKEFEYGCSELGDILSIALEEEDVIVEFDVGTIILYFSSEEGAVGVRQSCEVFEGQLSVGSFYSIAEILRIVC